MELTYDQQESQCSLLPCRGPHGPLKPLGCRGQLSSTGQFSGSMLVCGRVALAFSAALVPLSLHVTALSLSLCFPFGLEDGGIFSRKTSSFTSLPSVFISPTPVK